VVRDYGLDMVVLEKTSHTSVMGTLGSRVVECAPPNVNLLPIPYATPCYLSDRHPVRATPARVDLAIGSYWNADNHSDHLLALADLGRH
jgi:hypothetical protein